MTVYNAFLDSLLQQLEDRFQPATTAMMLSALLPRYAIDACFEDVREGCVLIILMGQYSTRRLNLNLDNCNGLRL